MLSFVTRPAIGRKLATMLSLLLLALTGCASSPFNTGSNPPPVITVVLNLTTANVQTSGQKQFSATVSNAANPAVTWQVNGVTGGDAAHGTIDANGLFTAPAGVPSPAMVTVTAIAQADSSKSASAQVTITAPLAISVNVAPTSVSLQVGQTQNFAATLTNDSQNKGVTWALSGSGCSGATCGTLSTTSSASGVAITYTAPASVPSSPTVTLTATSVADGTKSGTATITVTAAPVIMVTLAPTTASVQAGIGTQTFTATVTNDSQNKGVTWSLSGTGCSGATCGTLSTTSSASGTPITYTAPTNVPTPATVTITATSVTDGTKSATATITVTAPPAIVVSVSPSTANVQAGIGTQAFTATVTNDSQNKGVTWALSGAGCSGATCGTLSATASASGTAIIYTAPTNAPSPAVATLTATSVSDNTKSSAATVTVTPAVSVAIVPPATSVQTSQPQIFTANVSNDAQNKGVTWALSGAGCSGATCGTLSATTSQSGVGITYTAPASVPSPATVTLTATSVTDPTRNNTATVTITTAPVIGVVVAPGTSSVQAGIGTQPFTATVTNDSQNKGVTWTLSGAGCSGATCGSLSTTSSASGTPITYTAPLNAPTPGTVILTATSVADNSKLGTATITVTAGIGVSVAPATASVQAPSGTQAFTATVTNDSQNKGVTWTLSGAGCTGATCGTLSATSSASGVAITYTAPANVPAPATVTITATSVADGTKNGTATITLTAPPVITVSVAPGTANVQAGSGTQLFTATVTNDSQNKGVTWALSGAGCSGATCGTLSTTSSASGVAITYTAPASVPAPATVTITATSVTDGTKQGIATITVTAAPVITVSVAPITANVQANVGTQAFTATVTNDSQNKGVTWTLSGSGCSGATCGTLSTTSSASGTPITYTAPANVPSPATVTITATSVANGTKIGTATITVTQGVSVSVAPKTATIQQGQTGTFTATVSNDSQNKGVTWALSGAGCSGATCGTLSATSSASGAAITYTAPAVIPSPATVTLTATSVTDGTKSDTATITVTAVVSNISVAISPKRGGLTLGQALNFSATVTNDIGNAGVTWSASNGSCSGNACGTFSSVTTGAATYTAPSSAGVYTITATSVADTTKSASATIGVTDLAGVYTYHNDLSRAGVNAKEYALTTSNVNSTTFQKLFSCPIDAPAYAQPLWVANLSIGGGTHNVVYAATVRNSVYAFDADNTTCTTYWHKTLMPAGETYLNFNDVSTDDINPDIGIVGTPVIDPSTNTLYVVTKSEDTGSSCVPSAACHQRLHALNLSDGSEKFNGPVDITASITVPGNGDGSIAGLLVPFNPLTENQRPGLALVNGVVYVSWASHGDNDPYHGWVIGFQVSGGTLGIVSNAVLNTTPNLVSGFTQSRGGIWMSGGAPAADSSGNLYVLTGNGSFDANNSGGLNYGDSTLKIGTSGGLSILDWFTPWDESSLSGGDTDHGSGGAAILVDQPSSPHPHLVIGGGKAGNLFLLDRDNMGHYHTNDNNQVVQSLSFGNAIFATAAFWNNSIYLAGVSGPMKAFSFNTTIGRFNTSSTSTSANNFSFPGATPSVSSTPGGTTGTNIVWAIDSSAYGTPCCANGPAVVYAYDATNLATKLWDSSQGSGNPAGNAVKFTVPTVANGKVYVGTRGAVNVYGLKPN